MIVYGTVHEDDSAPLVGQFRKATTGALLIASEVSAVTWGLWKDNGAGGWTQVVAPGTSLTTASVWNDTAITNAHLWGLDNDGANFLYVVAKDVLTDADTVYRAEVEVTETGGAQTTQEYRITTIGRETS